MVTKLSQSPLLSRGPCVISSCFNAVITFMKKRFIAGCMVCLAGILGAAWLIPTNQPLWMWGAAGLSMIGFILCLGAGAVGRPLGVLVNEQNVMSLSRFQTAVWTVIVLSILVVIVSIRIHSGVLNIKFSAGVLELLGISAVALVGSPLIESTKKGKPDDSVAPQTAAALRKSAMVPPSVADKVNAAGAKALADHKVATAALTAAQDPKVLAEKAKAAEEKGKTDSLADTINDNAQGLLYKNPSISDARFSDIFRGSEVGNFAQLDLAKVQMFFFTLVVGVAYIYALTGLISGTEVSGATVSMPPLSDGMVGLLAISNGSYLGAKSVNHTMTTSS
jgi:hypothetical protein